MMIFKFILMMVAIWCAMMWGFGAGKFKYSGKPTHYLLFKKDIEYWMTWGFMMGAFVCGTTAVLL